MAGLGASASAPALTESALLSPSPVPLSRRSSHSQQAVVDSMEQLKTMRARGAGMNGLNGSVDGILFLRQGEMALNRRMWKEGADQLLVCLAHNGGDPLASAFFSGAVEHIRRDRPFWDPVMKRQSLDFGLVRTRTRRAKPEERAARPQRTIIDDFAEQWRVARMEETVKARSGYVPHEELAELRTLMHRDYYIPLRNIFRYYARLDGAKVKSIAIRARKVDAEDMYTINHHEFDAFVADCGLLSRELTSAKVNLVFISSNKDPPKGLIESMARVGAPVALDVNSKLTMVLPEFMNAVVRLANLRYGRVARRLADRFAMLMERDVLPNARWDDVQEFRRLAARPEVQDALVDVRPTVRFLFERYRNRDANATRAYGAEKSRSISIREYMAMFSDLGLMQDRRLSAKDVQDAFATSQADPAIDDDVTIADDHGKDNLEELILPEFEEALLRCAVARFVAEPGSAEGEDAPSSRLPPVPRRYEAAGEPEPPRAATGVAAVALGLRSRAGASPEEEPSPESAAADVCAAIASFFEAVTRSLVERKIIRPRRAHAPLLTSASILRHVEQQPASSLSAVASAPTLGRPRPPKAAPAL